MTKDEALRLALAVLQFDSFYGTGKQEAITAIKAALEAKDEQCRHRIADARNPVVKDGYLCVDCGALFSAADHAMPKQEAKDEPVAIKWEKDADKECKYNNWVGTTPFGRILITWKGWKEYHDACVDEFPGDFQFYGLPDEVKAACESEYLRRLYTNPPQRKPLTDDNPLMVFAKECVLGAYPESELADAARRSIKAAHKIYEIKK